MRLALAGCLMLACAPALAQSPPEIPFDSVPNFLKLPPDMHLGEGAGVAVNSKKHIFVFHRGNVTGAAYKAQAAQLLEFGPDGRYIREIGKNLYAWSFAHVVRVDKDDNIWAVDKGSDQIVKFNPQGRVEMVFGRKAEASDEESEPYKRVGQPKPTNFDNGRFRQPTDVTWDPQGNAYFSDGYWNSRVGKVDKNGDWVKSSSTRRIRSRRTPRAISMSPTAAIAAFRSSTAMGNSCAPYRSICRCRPTRIPPSATSRRPCRGIRAI
jgi:streptogramin lyase